MRLLCLFLSLVLSLSFLPLSARAACDGRDLRPELPPEVRAELDQAISETLFPEGNHWIARKDETVLHLIGTLHLNDPRMTPVVNRLEPVLSQADAFYFEVTQAEMHAFEQGLASDFSPVLITSGPTLIDLISEDDWAALSATLAERGIPSWMAAKMRPWFLGMILSIPACLMQNAEGNHGMDARLAELAEAYDIPQHSLESIEELMALFDTYPLEEQARSLAQFTASMATNEDHLATMANAYLEEKHAEIMHWSRQLVSETTDMSAQEFDVEWDAFEQQMLIQRNTNWMRHILAIQDQTAVIAVGAAHLHAEHGLLNQLQNAGYSVTRAPF